MCAVLSVCIHEDQSAAVSSGSLPSETLNSILSRTLCKVEDTTHSKFMENKNLLAMERYTLYSEVTEVFTIKVE